MPVLKKPEFDASARLAMRAEGIRASRQRLLSTSLPHLFVSLPALMGSEVTIEYTLVTGPSHGLSASKQHVMADAKLI